MANEQKPADGDAANALPLDLDVAAQGGEAVTPHQATAALREEAEGLTVPPGNHPRFEELQSRIAALEGQIRGTRRPWFREATSLVAVLALAFSFGTTIVSLNRTNQQDENEKKSQLLSLIDQLSTITRAFADAQTAYANNPGVLSTLSSVLTQEELLAAEQAASIMAQIPNDVGSAAYTFVANILVTNGLDELGLPLFQRAIDTATNANDLVGALRSKGFRDFAIGHVDEGRALFGQAVNVFDKFPNGSPSYVTYTQLQTQVGWTQAELFIYACDEAKVHLAAAQAFAVQVSQSDSRVQQLMQLVPLVVACIPSLLPPSGTFPPAAS